RPAAGVLDGELKIPRRTDGHRTEVQRASGYSENRDGRGRRRRGGESDVVEVTLRGCRGQLDRDRLSNVGRQPSIDRCKSGEGTSWWRRTSGLNHSNPDKQ